MVAKDLQYAAYCMLLQKEFQNFYPKSKLYDTATKELESWESGHRIMSQTDFLIIHKLI